MPLGQLALGLMFGGIVGNLIDRATAGYVLDFVDAYWNGWHFWAFNVADAAITLGAGAGQFQVDLATGIVTLGSTLAATTGQAIEAACEFDVPARFDVDDLALVLRSHEIGEWSDIPVVEIRE